MWCKFRDVAEFEDFTAFLRQPRGVEPVRKGHVLARLYNLPIVSTGQTCTGLHEFRQFVGLGVGVQFCSQIYHPTSCCDPKAFMCVLIRMIEMVMMVSNPMLCLCDHLVFGSILAEVTSVRKASSECILLEVPQVQGLFLNDMWDTRG
ncbi:Hypp4200 [Branchiostoma lanceolatum]|uniref:Hypp4200 protein n=1 Tax=Branchiostoma lanceolatum TaxID=7740 RepID=A0A8K0EUQ9_BRALA|nr:Hypp4200 [Branchiostoma lanceolatum]